MTTETLIRALAERVPPVRRVGHPLIRFGGWVVAATIWIAVGVAAVGVRGDLAAAWRAPGFVLQVIAPLAVGMAATSAAFAASVPSRGSRWWGLLLATLAASLLAFVVGGALSAGDGHAGVGARCIRNLVVLGVPPGLVLYLMLRKAAPLDRGTVGMLAAVGTAALAQVGTRFLCHHDGALHMAVWHYSFVFVLGSAGIVIGRAFFK